MARAAKVDSWSLIEAYEMMVDGQGTYGYSREGREDQTKQRVVGVALAATDR